jgi:hypothetical protein
VDGDAAESSIALLYLADMNAAPNAHTELLCLLLEATACPDRAHGALEGGHEAIARLIDERAPEGGDRLPAEATVLSK